MAKSSCPGGRRAPAAEIRRTVDEYLGLMQLDTQADKKPALLSGGQKQRVAVARALVNKPEILLLDEPLAALDLKLRQRMLVELDNIHDEVGITFIFVTHDQGEAMSISDRIAVMNGGRVEQIGSAAEIYEAPRSSFVAAFIGDTNFFDAVVLPGNADNPDYCRLRIEGFGDFLGFNDKKYASGQLAHLSIRPEKFRISRAPRPPDPLVNGVAGKVEEIIYQGTHTSYWVRAGEYRVAVRQPHNRFKLDQEPITWKDAVWRVLLPLLAPGILAGGLLAFSLSVDDFVITFFVAGPGSTTLPIKIYSMIKYGKPPVINALSSLILCATFLLIWASYRLREKQA